MTKTLQYIARKTVQSRKSGLLEKVVFHEVVPYFVPLNKRLPTMKQLM